MRAISPSLSFLCHNALFRVRATYRLDHAQVVGFMGTNPYSP
jgi:hypothetical protein